MSSCGLAKKRPTAFTPSGTPFSLAETALHTIASTQMLVNRRQHRIQSVREFRRTFFAEDKLTLFAFSNSLNESTE